jgi:restriction endonuclease S subunit
MELGEIADVKLGYTLRERPELSAGPNAVPVILPKDIPQSNQINYDGVTAIDIPNPGKFILSRGEVLLQSRGKFIAAVYNPPAGRDYVASSMLLRIIPKSSSHISADYLAMYLNSTAGQNQMKRAQSGGTATALITKSELEKIQIPVPTFEIQEKLASLSTGFSKWSVLHTKQMDLAKKIFDDSVMKIIGEMNG